MPNSLWPSELRHLYEQSCAFIGIYLWELVWSFWNTYRLKCQIVAIGTVQSLQATFTCTLFWRKINCKHVEYLGSTDPNPEGLNIFPTRTKLGRINMLHKTSTFHTIHRMIGQQIITQKQPSTMKYQQEKTCHQYNYSGNFRWPVQIFG